MRPRHELAVGLGAGVLLGALLIAQAGTVPAGALDLRLSTYRHEPNGASAWSEAVARLGHPVRRWERPLADLPDGGPRALLVILSPDQWLDSRDQEALARWGKGGGHLLVAGAGFETELWCQGWRRDYLPTDGIAGHFSAGGRPYTIPAIHQRLTPVVDSLVIDSLRMADLGVRICRPRRGAPADTLLRSPAGSPLAVRVEPKGGGTLTMVGDAALFSNQSLRESAAGEFTLSLLPSGVDTVVVDEYVHAYGSRGSLTAAILSWSVRDPVGWGLWQVAAVAALALLVGAARTGPLRRLHTSSRRTALEHVQALARTLGASHGHDVAIGLLIRGLRRRLSAPGRSPGGDPRQWLQSCRERTPVPAVRRAIDRLLGLTTPGQGAEGVLAAANAVEEVWRELRP